MRNTTSGRWSVVAFLAGVALLVSADRPRTAANTEMDDEQQVGQEVFNELKSKGEIIASSPLYDTLVPIAEKVMHTAQPRYNHPFKLYLVHEKQPNAFATPGGNTLRDGFVYAFSSRTWSSCRHVVPRSVHTIHHDRWRSSRRNARRAARDRRGGVRPTRPSACDCIDRKAQSLGY
jgi:Zn-dependent protease with chaperone function